MRVMSYREHQGNTSSPSTHYRFSAVPEWVTYHPDLNGEQVRLFSALARHANAHRVAWPSHETLAARLNRSESSIKRDLHQLSEVGAIIVVERFLDGRQLSNTYEIAGDTPLDGKPLPPPVTGGVFTDEPPGGFTGDLQNESHRNDIGISNEIPGGRVTRDSLFEAFYEFWTDEPYRPGAVLTKGQRGRISQAVNDAVAAGIGGEEVRKRGQRYRREWKDMDHTPQALLTHWHRFAEDSPSSSSLSPDGPIPGMTPPRNDPKSCRHRAMQASGFCVGCESQVAAPGKDGEWHWLPGMEPPGGRSMPTDRASPAEYTSLFNDDLSRDDL